MAAVVGARRYAIGCVCLLIVAGALRFYELGASSLWHDEAIAAVNSRGSLMEVIANAGGRYSNTSPALYPVMLWVVQKAGESEFSARVLPALASLLTVGALLLWMPRLGVARRAAFMAGLLAALSAAGIEHARDGREYSVDALLAVLMIGGALQYLRNGGKGLLCVALFAAPLLQYGLALLCVGALGVAAVAPLGFSAWPGWVGARGLWAAVWGRARSRVDLVLPLGAFVAGCALSWGLTARYQLAGRGWGQGGYLADFYYDGGVNAAAFAEFAGGRTWSLLSYHMPMGIAALAVGAFVVAAALALRRGRLDGLGLLFLFAIVAAVCAAALEFYPFGGSRHNIYLGPLIFLAAGVAFHWAAVYAGAVARRAWVGTALGAALAVGIAVWGAAAVRQADVYRVDTGIERVLAALESGMREGDAVYVSRPKVPVLEFYKDGRPSDYFYGKVACWGASPADWADCFPEMMDEMFRLSHNYRRIWLIHNTSASATEEMAGYSAGVKVDVVDVGGLDALGDRKIDVWTWPQATLQLITGFDELVEGIRGDWLELYVEVASGAPSAVSAYDLYLRDDALYYAKRPCVVEDTEARFFLHLHPEDGADLPAWRREYGFDNLDFAFLDHGLLVGDRCIIRRALPGYAIERIRAGQFIPPGGPRLWEVELAVGR